ncbi:MAG TPA: CARDB domain-containing protein [Myxococcota bacterium]|nr:CARDB domain-containing protein [Myxococcota bacterium]
MNRASQSWAAWTLGVGFLMGAAAASAGTHQTGIASASNAPAGMAIDAADRLHFSWQSPNDQLHYTRIDGHKKISQLVDDTKDAGRWSAVAADSAGNPYIVYYAFPQDPPRVALRVAHFDGVSWQHEELGDGGFSPAMAFDPNDQPAFVTTESSSQAFEYYQRVNGEWEGDFPEAFAAQELSPLSLVLDSAGHAHVGLTSTVPSRPVYATNATGDWVQTELADEGGTASVALDSLGHPRAALALTQVVRYTWFDGESWQSEDVFDPNDVPEARLVQPGAASLALDAHDRPRILIMAQGEDQHFNGMDLLIYAYQDGVSWRLLRLANGADFWTRLVVDSNGVSHGLYGKIHGSDADLVKTISIALPDVTGEWTGLTVTPQKGGAQVTGTLSVRNDGPGSSKKAQLALYLSDDALLDPNDTPVATRASVPGLGAGKTKLVKVSFTSPAPLTATHLIAVVDPNGLLDDTDRPNNTIVGDLTP